MKNVYAAIVLVIAGCQHAHLRLYDRLGWNYDKLPDNEFRINIHVSQSDADRDGMAVAADLALTYGFNSYYIIADVDRPNSGTLFEWRDDYLGRPGIKVWRFGSSFRIKCYKDRADGKKLIDAVDELKKYVRGQPKAGSS